MNPWEKFKLKYPLGRIKYSIDGEYRGMIKLNSLNVLCGYVILPKIIRISDLVCIKTIMIRISIQA